jgi:hypothetical protein
MKEMKNLRETWGKKHWWTKEGNIKLILQKQAGVCA